jgi:hypothetical protein
MMARNRITTKRIGDYIRNDKRSDDDDSIILIVVKKTDRMMLVFLIDQWFNLSSSNCQHVL